MHTRLVFTHYLDAAPDAVTADLQRAVTTAAADTPAAAAGRSASTEPIEGGLRIAGFGDLDGSEIRVEGTPRLTSVVISVPWASTDAATRKAIRASRFAESVVGEVELAA